ncbi:hypothetical protein [Dactylosporangium sp. NPDC005555]|uniref:hypothetical protein n=1 Tax=Dactylosporangium sp. NPDC005555 TaxID=3154889 RepID=UPI0033BE0DFA
MSDGYIRLIPTDREWQPTQENAAAATAYVARLFSGPEDDVEEVEHEFYDRITVIDAGENTTRISCPNCDGDIDVYWFFDLLEENGESFDSLNVSVPCCGAVVALDSLRYDWPVGFARFEVCAMNPSRARYELDAEELDELAALLGHPIAQILAHY